VKSVLKRNDVSLTKVTHFGRVHAAQMSSRGGAAVVQTKAHGLWSENGSYRSCYDRTLPIETILVLAGSDPKHPERYFIERDAIPVDPNLASQIFPWVELEIAKYTTRWKANEICKDISLKNFLNFLVWCRSILLQDLAVLYQDHSKSAIFQFAPFNTQQFYEYTQKFQEQLTLLRAKSLKALDSYPEDFVGDLRSILIAQQMENLTRDRIFNSRMNGLETKLDLVLNLLTKSHTTSQPSKRIRLEDPIPISLSSTETQTLLAPTSTSSSLRDVHSSTTFISHPRSSQSPPSTSIIASTVPTTSTLLIPGISATNLTSKSPTDTLVIPSVTVNLPLLMTPELAESFLQRLPNHHNLLALRQINRQMDNRSFITPFQMVDGDWIPVYPLVEVKEIWDVWIEYHTGLDGKLSILELETRWNGNKSWRSAKVQQKGSATYTVWNRKNTVRGMLEKTTLPPYNLSVDRARIWIQDEFTRSQQLSFRKFFAKYGTQHKQQGFFKLIPKN
jgi:hypothetical protein